MTRVRIWAPEKHAISLVARGETTAMEKAPDGYFEASVALASGERYAFRVEGGPPLPDPRSRSQPDGVHAASEWQQFEANGAAASGVESVPLSEAVFYELHVGTFSPEGTFDGAIALLPELVALGITHVELMPVASFPGKFGWGYDGVSLFAPHVSYGGPEGLLRFVRACHAQGLGVILDVVYNHLGPSGNYLGAYGPYFTARYNTPWGQALNFDDAYSDEVRKLFIDNALMWLRDYAIDGLRLDAVHAIFDGSATHILEELASAVGALNEMLGKKHLLIAESDLNDPRLVRAQSRGGYGLDAMWSDDFHHALHSVISGERTGYYEDFGQLAQLAKVLRDGFAYDGGYSPHRKRRHGRSATDIASECFVVCMQNHDQVGNRATGDRIHHATDLDLVKMGAALLLLSPFTPLLFQGEEWAATSPFAYFTDHAEPELADAVRNGRRREFAAFGWKPQDIPDPQSEETFLSSKLRWAERQAEPHSGMLTWYRELIALRKRLGGSVSRSEVSVTFDEAQRYLVLNRDDIRLIMNFGPQPLSLESPEGGELLLASHKGATIARGRLQLPGRTAVVLRR